MKQLLLSLAVVALAAPAADASFLLDDFETPTVGAQIADGSTVALDTPPNFFGNRTVDGDVVSTMSINNGTMDGTLLAGESAFIEWTNPVFQPTGPTAPWGGAFAGLILDNYIETLVSDTTYNVTLNGASISGGEQVLSGSGGFLRADAGVFAPGDVLRVTFNVAPGGVALFSAGSIVANPEPMSAGLFGLALFGGVCRHRRRRD